MRFSIWVVQPAADTHWRAFEDFERGLIYSLRALGHEVASVGAGDPAHHADMASRLIVFNAHRLATTATLPDDAIIYNAEQIPIDARAAGPGWGVYLERLRHHMVWDYSETNIERMRLAGVQRVAHCRVGFYEEISYDPSKTFDMTPVKKDIDVLFVGSTNPRRAMALFSVAKLGVRVESCFDVYGKERDALVHRAKVVLNVHFYPKPIFEIFRVSHLLRLGACVVTEDGGCDPQLEALAEAMTVRVPYAKLGETCAELVRDEAKRIEAAKRGYFAFRRYPQIEAVGAALEATR